MGPAKPKRRRQSSSPEDTVKKPPAKPSSKKGKVAHPPSDEDFDEDDFADVLAPTKPDAKSKNKSTGPRTGAVTAKVGRRTRRGKLGNHMKKSDIVTSGSRFVDDATPLEVVSKTNLTNLERFNVVLNRMNQTDRTVADKVTKTEDASTPTAAPAQTASTSATQKSDTKPKIRTAKPGLPQTSAAGQAAQTVVQQTAQPHGTGIDFILQQPIIDNRNYETNVGAQAKGVWGMVVRYRPAPGKKLIDVLTIKVKTSDYSKAECESIVPMLARFCERWPFPVGGLDVRFKENLLAVFSYQLFPNKGFTLRGMRQNKERYRFFVNIINPDTGKMEDEETTMAWAEFETIIKPIPPLPPHVAPSHDSKLGAADTTAKKNAMDFIKFVAWRYHGKIISSTSFQHEYANLQHEYTGKYGIRTGTVKQQSSLSRKGKPKAPPSTKLYDFQRHSISDTAAIRPSAYFSDQVGAGFKDIRLYSLSRARLAHVADAMDDARNANPADLRNAWKAGCLAADAMNNAIKRKDPPPSQCKCKDQAEKSTTEHRCLACLKQVLCSTMLPDERSEPVWKDCAAKEARTSDQQKAELAKRHLNATLLRIIVKEIDAWESTADNTDEETKAARESMRSATFKQLSENLVDHFMVQDAYTDVKRSLLFQQTQGGSRDPFMASIDAVFPYGHFEGERRLHSPNNTVHTALWLNFMKHVYLPATLPMMAAYVNADPTTRDTSAFLKEMDDVYRCGRIMGYSKKQRLGVPFSRREYAKHLKMWRTAVPATLSDAAKRKLYKYVKYNLANDAADFVDKERLLKAIRQIENKFGVKLLRGKDGCPWPEAKETMPDDWCWGNCWSLYSERQRREWDLCNRNGEQVDTTETLYLEHCWQQCDPTYTEFLGLILVAWRAHPCRFTIGKRNHNLSMRTGWKTVTPSSIDDRDDALNNVLFESCTFNWLKNNFADSECAQIRQEISRISLSNEYFDPELRQELLEQSAASGDSFFIEDIDDIDEEDIQDDFGGADFDASRIYDIDEDRDQDQDQDDDEDLPVNLEQDEAEAESKQDSAITELDDEDLMSKVTSLEQDMMRMAGEIVNQSRRDLQYSGIPHHELLQDAASGQISMRIAGLRRNKNADEDDSLVLTVVQNRILEGHGMWAGTSDEDDDMLME